jgi:site-specific DNA recombinase
MSTARAFASVQIPNILRKVSLKDTFYFGMMKAKGELLPHKHEPIISYELFQKVQEVISRYNKKPFQHVAKPFIFRGMISCENYGCLVSPEIKIRNTT